MRDFKFFSGPTYPTNIDPDTIPIPERYDEYQASYFRNGWIDHFNGIPVYSCPFHAELNKRLWEHGWTNAYHYRQRLLQEITNIGDYDEEIQVPEGE